MNEKAREARDLGSVEFINERAARRWMVSRPFGFSAGGRWSAVLVGMHQFAVKRASSTAERMPATRN